MTKQHKDPLINAIYDKLKVGSFISYDKAWPFVGRLEKLSNEIDQVAALAPSRAAKLYEVFLAGSYDKVEEIDDSGGNLAMFFEDLFLQWIATRQRTKDNPEDIIADIIRWQQHDDYGFMYDIEKNIAKVLNKACLALYKTHFDSAFSQAYQPFDTENPKVIFDYPYEVRKNAKALKAILVANRDENAYLALCDKILLSPKDYEQISEIVISKKNYPLALEMINKGLTLEKTGQWGNESSYSLVNHKKAVLGKLGRADQALQMAWADFKRSPCAYRYQDLMVYVKKTEHKLWHKRAMKAAENQLSGFIEISVLTKEWQSLAERVLAENDEALADISHFTSEPAAKALEKKYPLASAKLYFNMGNRILEAKKSKYYPTGIRNFKSARKLWLQEGDKETWAKAVSTINAKHYRKYSFIHDFNDMAEGKPRKKAISEQKKDRILNYSKESFFKKEKG